ncbi:hypothetical protein FKW77_000828 [Venturia effusa]|uniref:N-acetyltransferase domain-containing protein n=1 Tax=Venturia effusa TaxID=50376 RepID=A0A517LPI1_9PEZI|nr:hypothetical protein FKW77_000828 [Venturia effusa]
MDLQQANKAKWLPPHARRVATAVAQATIEQVELQAVKQSETQAENQVEMQPEVKKSGWTPPHLRKAQKLPVTPAPSSKQARVQLNPNSPEYKPASLRNGSDSSTGSISPPPNRDAFSATVKSASSASIFTVSPVSAKSNSSSEKTYMGMGLMGSRWAPVRPTAEQIAIAEAPETMLKAKANLMAIHMVMDTQQKLVDKRKKEALENGGEGLRYSSDYRKIQEENEQKVAEIAKEIMTRTGAVYSCAASDESRSLFFQRSASPADAPAKAASSDKQSAQGEPTLIASSDASAKADSSTKEPVPHFIRSNESVEAVVCAKNPAQALDIPNVEDSKSASLDPCEASVEATSSTVKESACIQVSNPATCDASSSEDTVQPPAKCISSSTGAEKVSHLTTSAKPAVGLATSFTQWTFQSKPNKTGDSSVARPKTVASTTPARSSAPPSVSESTGGSQKDDEQCPAAQSAASHSNAVQSITALSTAAQNPAPGLTADATASDCSSHSSADDITMVTTTKMLLPASVTPYEPRTTAPDITESSLVVPVTSKHIPVIDQHATAPAISERAAELPVQEVVDESKIESPEQAAASKPKAATPIKLATTLEGFTNFRPARNVSAATNNMPRRSGWLTKAETKAMRSRPLGDCVINEDDFDGEIQNDDWPSADENSPDLCLRQWDGDWLPAPVDWAGRNQFKRADKFAEDIATWIDRTNYHYLIIQNGTSKITVELLDHNGKMITYEHVPRSWVPAKIERQSLQEFWNNLKQSNPEPIDAEDLRVAPYWQRYLTSAHKSSLQEVTDFQEPLPCPSAALNVAECGLILYQRGKNQTAETTSRQIAEKKLKDAARKETIRQKHYKIMKKESKRPVVTPPPNPHKPAANIYLRPANNRDDAQMAHIYNHYVNTHYSSAMAPITAAEMSAMRQEIAAANLNMIVAVLKVKQAGLERANLQSTQEKVVGFAYTDEHEGPHSLFRYAADLEVFVHPDYARNGVGKSLVDRLMFLADSQYVSRDAVEWRPMSGDLHLTTSGGKRSLGTVHINVFYPTDDAERLVWLGTWLKQFDFERRGRIEGGIKLQKNVTMACFVHKNAQTINPVSARN